MIFTVHFAVPVVEFEDEPLPSDTVPQPSTPTTPVTPTSPTSRPSRLSRYLHDLALRPNNPPDDVDEPGFRQSVSFSPAGLSVSTSASNLRTGNGLSSISSFANLASIAGGGSSQTQSRNPETDSFAYIETLLESLAVLGKLGSGLDVVAQRLSSEIFTLIENTIEEVGERAEYGRRASMLINSTTSSTAKLHSAYMVAPTSAPDGSGIGSVGTMFGFASGSIKGTTLSALRLRLTALESSSQHVDHEILRDLFWTLYSKLDAVTQGLRVVYEVANRIGSVSLLFCYSQTSSRVSSCHYHLHFNVATRFQGLFWNQAGCPLSISRSMDARSSRGTFKSERNELHFNIQHRSEQS